MSSYGARSEELDREILAHIARWHATGATIPPADFDDLALRLFAYQVRYNAAYARYAGSFGYSPTTLPKTWHDIPPVPAAAYKEVALATFEPSRAALAFETSGTTRNVGGIHYMETPALYDAALLAGFDRLFLAGAPQLRYLNLVPNPAQRPRSSLGYMMARVSAMRGDGNTGWYLSGDDIFVDAFLSDVQTAIADARPVCIATTAFALVHVLDAMRAKNLTLALPPGSRIMETGGFKGRSRRVGSDELYADACARFVLSPQSIVAEYGMTELSSQYYDVLPPAKGARVKISPPWLRARVVGGDGSTLPEGTAGALVHVDLANRSSCLALVTEDLGVQVGDGIVLFGRDDASELRGCSLDAEELLRR